MRGKKANEEPTVALTVYIPISISAQVDLLLVDPMRKRTAYGKKSALVTMLLRRWVAEQSSMLVLEPGSIQVLDAAKPGHTNTTEEQGV
ncbi:MAG TPA: hypothetical protein VLH56_19030 [Dissulfurispiraceae bacterium]|nr:hypothetical protein [Dissulfurispiraceae bacterium]